MKNFLFILLVFSTSAFSQRNFSFNPDADTLRFKAVYQDFASGRVSLDKRKLSQYQVLFVQGLATNITHQIGRVVGPLVSKQDGLLSSFYQQKRLLDQIGIPSSFVPLNPNDGCEKNGDMIANTILQVYARHQKKVLLITQSKAGPDALHGLVSNYLAVDKVAGWLAFQPPHYGTYLAEAPSQGRVGSRFVDILFKVLKGSGLAIKDMRRDFRMAWMGQHAYEIHEIVKKIPIVSLVTDDLPLKHAATGSLKDYFLVPFRGQNNRISFLTPFVGPITNHGGGINDGIAMVEGTCIEGGLHCVYLHGIDHFAGVMNTSPWKTLTEAERLLLFQSLLKTLTQYLK